MIGPTSSWAGFDVSILGSDTTPSAENASSSFRPIAVSNQIILTLNVSSSSCPFLLCELLSPTLLALPEVPRLWHATRVSALIASGEKIDAATLRRSE